MAKGRIFNFPMLLLLKYQIGSRANFRTSLPNSRLARSPAETPSESDTERKTCDTALVRLVRLWHHQPYLSYTRMRANPYKFIRTVSSRVVSAVRPLPPFPPFLPLSFLTRFLWILVIPSPPPPLHPVRFLQPTWHNSVTLYLAPSRLSFSLSYNSLDTRSHRELEGCARSVVG